MSEKLTHLHIEFANNNLKDYELYLTPLLGSSEIAFGTQSLAHLDEIVPWALNRLGLSRKQGTIVFSRTEARFIPEDKPRPLFYNGNRVGKQGVPIENGLQFKVGESEGVVFEIDVDVKNRTCRVHDIKIVFNNSSVEKPRSSRDIVLPSHGILFLEKETFARLRLDEEGISDKHLALSAPTMPNGEKQVIFTVLKKARVEYTTLGGTILLKGFNPDLPIESQEEEEVQLARGAIVLHDGDLLKIGRHTFSFAKAEWKLKFVKTE